MRSTWTPVDVSQQFGGIGRPWWIAGGWAIDLWLGRGTRNHEDLDVAILRPDLGAFRERLAGWELHLAHDDGLAKLSAGDDVAPALHAIWCRSGPADGWAFELLLNDVEGREWIFRRDRSIRRPLRSVTRRSTEGLPLLAPEIVLLFKAKEHRPRDEADFQRTLPTLSREQTRWLASALTICHPAHPWLGGLDPSEQETDDR